MIHLQTGKLIDDKKLPNTACSLKVRGFARQLPPLPVPRKEHAGQAACRWAVQKYSKVFFNRLKLTESKHEIMCQQLSLYADWSLFKAIESKFISKFSNQPVIRIAFYWIGVGYRK
jgi:hypothetical protein